MHDLVAHLMDHVLPEAPVRQWVLSPPFELAGLLAVRPKILSHLARCFVHAVETEMKRAVVNDVPQQKLHTGAIVFIQRFTKTMTLFPHLHVLFLDGIYFESPNGHLEFRSFDGPTEDLLARVLKHVFQRMERFLKRNGYLGDGTEKPTPLERWWFRATQEPSLLKRGLFEPKTTCGSQFGGFSIHAGVRIQGHDKRGREKLVKYMARPPFSEEQLKILNDGKVELTLRSPSKTGQRSVMFESVQFLRRLAWLIPPAKQNMIRYYGVFAPHAKHRRQIVLSSPPRVLVSESPPTSPYRRSWAKLLSRVYDIDAEVCLSCGGRLRPAGAVTKRTEAEARLRRGLSVLGYARAPPDAA